MDMKKIIFHDNGTMEGIPCINCSKGPEWKIQNGTYVEIHTYNNTKT